MVKREEVKKMRWKLRYCTKMLQKQRASGYWDQTAPKVTRNREAKCVTESKGVSKRVSILPSDCCCYFGAWRWDDAGSPPRCGQK